MSSGILCSKNEVGWDNSSGPLDLHKLLREKSQEKSDVELILLTEVLLPVTLLPPQDSCALLTQRLRLSLRALQPHSRSSLFPILTEILSTPVSRTKPTTPCC